MIDLHIHSIYSDGTDNIKDILKQAEALKLNTISITDHENCNVYKEIEELDVKRYFSGKIIPGIELKAQYNGRVIDILGYNIDYKKMNEGLVELFGENGRAEIQIKQLNEFYEYGKKYGLSLAPQNELKWDKKRDWSSIVFYNEIKRYEENRLKLPEDLWEGYNSFKINYYNKKGGMFYIDRAKYYPLMKDILNIIHKSGGLAFVAHVFEYSWMEDKVSELKKIIKEFDIDGVECYYSNFSDSEIKKLVEFCEKNSLLVSGGTDYHGSNRPEIKLGIGRGCLEVPDSIIYNWDKTL